MREICSVKNCDGIVKAKGLCNKHHHRMSRYGDTELRRHTMPTGGKCTVIGCAGVARGSGMCNKHYRRFKKYGDPKKGHQKMSIKDRLIKKIKININTGCWDFTGSKDLKGYGKLWDGNTMRSAHRISFIEYKGSIPDGLFVLHKCDNPGCINPDHLFLGTHNENMEDMRKKGRSCTEKRLCGSRNFNSKLSENDIPKIKKRLLNGESCKKIAESYSVDRTTISFIKNGTTWKHLKGENNGI